MFVESRYRSWCVLVLLSLCICSTVYGEVPVFDDDPCVEEVNIQPDANKNEARAFWNFPTATADGGSPAAVSCDQENGGLFSGGTTTVTCTATDTTTISQTATCSFDVKVYPIFSVGCPSNTILATEDTLDFTIPTAVDSSEANPEVDCTPPAGSSFSEPATEVTCTATDSLLKDQNVSCTFIVSVGTIPAFDSLGSCEEPKIINIQPDGGSNTTSGFDWTVPVVSTGSSVTCEPDPGTAEFVGGETTVTCTATKDDTPTLINTCEFTVRVYPTFETACPANIIMETAGPNNFVTPTSNSDSEGTIPVVSCVPATGTEFSALSTDVTCTAIDSALSGQEASCTFTISVGAKPVFDVKGSCAVPANTDVPPDDGNTTASAITWVKPSATDATVSCEPNPDSTIFSGGETIVTCTATDDVTPTLIETCKFTVRVFPAFEGNTCVGDIIRQPGAGGVSAKVAWLPPTATGKNGAAADVVCDPASGSSFTGLETDVVCTASEGSDTSTCSFKVSIQPSFTQNCPSDMLLAADSNGEKVVFWEPLVGNPDSTGEPGKVTCNYESGWTFNLTETVVNCVVTDAGNSLTADCSFKVSLDFTAPSFTNGCPADESVAAESGSNKATFAWETPEADDDVTATADIKVSCVPASNSSFVFGSTTVTCVAVDSVGRTGLCDFTVNVTGADCSPACNASSTCTLSDKGVSQCICNEGYTLVNDSQCANTDECELDNPCHAEANCLDLDPPEMFNCSCKEGYFGDGVYSCSSAPAVFPDLDPTDNLEKIFSVELAIANSSVSSCDPEVDTESIECIALITVFKIQVTPLYQQVSAGSFKRIDVNQTSIRKGSVIIPHDVIYDYANKDIRGVSVDKFYSKSVKAAVESGMIGSLAVIMNCTTCQDPEDHTDVCAAAKCNEGYTLVNDSAIGICIPTCISVCSFNSEYCNGGSCSHDAGKPVVCSDCPSGTTGETCEPVDQVDQGSDLALILGLSIGLGVPALIVIFVIIGCCVHKNSKKSKVNMSGDGGRSNDAMAMENAGVAN